MRGFGPRSMTYWRTGSESLVPACVYDGDVLPIHRALLPRVAWRQRPPVRPADQPAQQRQRLAAVFVGADLSTLRHDVVRLVPHAPGHDRGTLALGDIPLVGDLADQQPVVQQLAGGGRAPSCPN